MNKLTVFVLCLFLSGQAFSLPSKEMLDKAKLATTSPSEVAFDDKENGFKFTRALTGYYFFNDKHVFEQEGLGYTVSYFDLTGTSITVYVYDKKRSDIQNGHSKPVSDELKSVISGIRGAGKYSEISNNILAPILSPDYSQISIIGKSDDGARIKDYTLMRGQNGKFIKVRITGKSPRMEERVSGFMIVLSEALGVEEAAKSWSKVVHSDDKSGFQFPRMLSQHFRFAGKAKSDDLRRGYQLSYIGIHGTSIKLWIYDAGLTEIPGGADSAEINQQFRLNENEMSAWAAHGEVQTVGDQTLFSNNYLQRSYKVAMKDGRQIKSYSLMRGQKGQFIKVTVVGTAAQMEERVGMFLQSLAQVIGLENLPNT
ncbi:hypothetical protein QSV34_12685 [Porticoccus sp. W117]|uniref:hypothetical protein n=1 Tax=Porticoccus sp. W117 TaxID=3054777 RepID=UPI002599FCB2|nr:hypothetical protein [Porticoccus sp. W117]MDM3872203.1 hypothetical protein [Porticoccus sp. W117]